MPRIAEAESAVIGLDAVAQLEMLERMWLIRAFEEKVVELFARGKIVGLLHLGIGQEGSAVGTCAALRTDDRVFGGHRSHAHAIAKGADVDRLMAELLGRTTGYCKGKGGSMHLSAPEVGFVTATGIVGANIQLALGAGLAAVTTGSDLVGVAFFGDGAGQSGGFHESLNLAALWNLPVIFVCENNGYAEFSPLSTHTVVGRLADYARVYSIPSGTVDGGDVLEVRSVAEEAVERARSGGGPTFIEVLTYRLRGHYEGDPARYRELAELEEWKAKDPVARFTTTLAETGVVEAEKIDGLEAAARSRIETAAELALGAPVAEPDDATTDVYV